MKTIVVNWNSTGAWANRCFKPSVGYGETLVKIEYFGVCHTELHIAHGVFAKFHGVVKKLYEVLVYQYMY